MAATTVRCSDCQHEMPYVMGVSMTGRPICPGCEQRRDEASAQLMAILGTVGCAAATGKWLDRLRIRRRRQAQAAPRP